MRLDDFPDLVGREGLGEKTGDGQVLSALDVARVQRGGECWHVGYA